MIIQQSTTTPPALLTAILAIQAATEDTATVTQPALVTDADATRVAVEEIANVTQPDIVSRLMDLEDSATDRNALLTTMDASLASIDALNTTLNALITTLNATNVSQLDSLNVLSIENIKAGSPLATSGKIVGWDDTTFGSGFPFTLRFTVPAGKVLLATYWSGNFTWSPDPSSRGVDLGMTTIDTSGFAGNQFRFEDDTVIDKFYNANTIIPTAYYMPGTEFHVDMGQSVGGPAMHQTCMIFGTLLDII